MEAARSDFQRTRGGIERGGLNSEACRGSFNPGTETCQTISRMKQHQRWHYRDQKFCRDKQSVTCQALRSHIAKHGATLRCKGCSFVSRGAKLSGRHSDECRQRIMEAVADDEGRMRTFLDKNAPRTPAPVIAGGVGAAPAIAAPSPVLVRLVRGAPSSSSGGARPSPMEAESEVSTQDKREQSSSSALAAAAIPEQRRKKRVRKGGRG